MAERSPFRYERADDSPGLLLWRLTALWQGRVSAALATFGLTQTQYTILASLRWFDEKGAKPSQRQLVEHTGVEKMTLSKAIRRLEVAGLVARRPAPHDARATEVQLTPAGRQLIGEAIVAVEETDERFFAGLSGRRRREWMTLSRALVEQELLTRAGPRPRPAP